MGIWCIGPNRGVVLYSKQGRRKDLKHLGKTFWSPKILKFPYLTRELLLRSICHGDWMILIDLKEAYLQIPIHPDSRKYLWFVARGKFCQFRVFCFHLTTAPQVFASVMAPVSVILHQMGVRILRYLSYWLALAGTLEDIQLANDQVLPYAVN